MSAKLAPRSSESNERQDDAAHLSKAGPIPVADDPESSPTRASRRNVLSAAGLGAVGIVGAACVPAPVAPPSAPPATVRPGSPPVTVPPTPLGAAQHLVRRATFGATAAEVSRARSMGLPAWVDQQLSRSGLPSAEAMLGASFPTLLATNAENDGLRETDSEQLFVELDHATLLRAVHSKQQLYEVMCDFWTNHLNIWRRADWLTQMKTLDNERVIRPHALGKFSDLLMASAKSPAMLVYLDNYQSRGNPGYQVNENYGRELLELHTLGIIDGQQVYTESDILGVAKVLSGWGINWDKGPSKFDFRFNYWDHSREAVSIFGGKWSRPARPNWGDYNTKGLGDGESLIRFLARHPSTARHICTKLVARFVSDVRSPALVNRLVKVYSANDTAITPVLRALFLSTEFAASANQKIKRPIDWLYSALRVSAAAIPVAPRGAAATNLRQVGAALGQPSFERVSPDGWPETAKHWIGADGLLKRWEYGALLAQSSGTDPAAVKVDVAALLPSTLPGDNSALIIWLAAHHLQIVIGRSDVLAICTALGLSTKGAASQLAGNTNLMRNCVGLLLAHPNFHRR